jgi:hypothetical protein
MEIEAWINMQADPIIDQIREVRHRISEQCGHDAKTIVEYYMNLDQTEYAERVKTSEAAIIKNEDQK